MANQRGAVFLLCLAACSSRELRNPVRVTLVNRTDQTVDGALLRFDRELARADRLSPGGFEKLRLRLAPANTLRCEGGRLAPGRSVTYEVAGLEGPPTPVEGRWLIGGRHGPAMGPDELRVR